MYIFLLPTAEAIECVTNFQHAVQGDLLAPENHPLSALKLKDKQDLRDLQANLRQNHRNKKADDIFWTDRFSEPLQHQIKQLQAMLSGPKAHLAEPLLTEARTMDKDISPHWYFSFVYRLSFLHSLDASSGGWNPALWSYEEMKTVRKLSVSLYRRMRLQPGLLSGFSNAIMTDTLRHAYLTHEAQDVIFLAQHGLIDTAILNASLGSRIWITSFTDSDTLAHGKTRKPFALLLHDIFHHMQYEKQWEGIPREDRWSLRLNWFSLNSRLHRQHPALMEHLFLLTWHETPAKVLLENYDGKWKHFFQYIETWQNLAFHEYLEQRDALVEKMILVYLKDIEKNSPWDGASNEEIETLLRIALKNFYTTLSGRRDAI